MNDRTRRDIVIKFNNTASNDPCAICGNRTDPAVGPELFLEGTWALVCRDCGKARAPELVACLDTASWEAIEDAMRQSMEGQS